MHLLFFFLLGHMGLESLEETQISNGRKAGLEILGLHYFGTNHFGALCVLGEAQPSHGACRVWVKNTTRQSLGLTRMKHLIHLHYSSFFVMCEFF